MPWDPSLNDLRGTLADLYPTEADARRIVASAGLDERRITFSGNALNTWQSILEEALKQERVCDVVKVALAEYRTNWVLRHAWRTCCVRMVKRAWWVGPIVLVLLAAFLRSSSRLPLPFSSRSSLPTSLHATTPTQTPSLTAVGSGSPSTALRPSDTAILAPTLEEPTPSLTATISPTVTPAPPTATITPSETVQPTARSVEKAVTLSMATSSPTCLPHTIAITGYVSWVEEEQGRWLGVGIECLDTAGNRVVGGLLPVRQGEDQYCLPSGTASVQVWIDPAEELYGPGCWDDKTNDTQDVRAESRQITLSLTQKTDSFPTETRTQR